MEAINRPPAKSDYTPLDEHREATPGTFFGGKPVLHLHSPSAIVKVPSDQFDAQPDLRQLSTSTSAENGSVILDGVDVWITSRNFVLYSAPKNFGLQIPYPAITVTAQDGAEVLLELVLSEPDAADEDIVFLQLRIKPSSSSGHDTDGQASAGAMNGTNPNVSAMAMFKAISDCQELNPDPPMLGEDGEDGEDDSTAPGATGWITSENMADFMVADGNFRIPEGMPVVGGEDELEGAGEGPLGEGAGRTRTAAEALDEEEDGSKRSRPN